MRSVHLGTVLLKDELARDLAYGKKPLLSVIMLILTWLDNYQTDDFDFPTDSISDRLNGEDHVQKDFVARPFLMLQMHTFGCSLVP